MHLPSGDADVLTTGEALIDFTSEEETDRLYEAQTFRRYLGGPLPTGSDRVQVYARMGGG